MYYVPQDQGDAEMLAERIAPRLQHANSAVVLTSVKVIMFLMNYMQKEEDITSMCRKLSPPLGMFLERCTESGILLSRGIENLYNYEK